MKRPHDRGRMTRPMLATIPGGAILETLLQLLLPHDLREEFIGDLIEAAHDHAREGGTAARWLWLEAARSAPALLVLRVRRRLAPAGQPALAAAALPLSEDELGHGFGAFLAAARAPRRRRPLPMTFAVVLHAALLVFGVSRSLWHVDEVTPPAVMVTWRPNPVVAPPPPAGPKPAEPPKAPSVAREPLDQSRLHQPPKKPPPEPFPPTGEIGGKGDDKGTSPVACPPGMICNGTTIVEAPLVVAAPPPKIAEKSCLDCPQPHLPPAFRRLGVKQEMLIRICADRHGAVTKTQVLRGISGEIDQEVAGTIARWRFSPFMVASNPVPFCYVSHFVFTTE